MALKHNYTLAQAGILVSGYKVARTSHEELRLIHELIGSLSTALSILDSCEDNVYFTINKSIVEA